MLGRVAEVERLQHEARMDSRGVMVSILLPYMMDLVRLAVVALR